MGGTLSSVPYQKPSLPRTRCDGKRALHRSIVVVVKVSVVVEAVVLAVAIVVVAGTELLLLPHVTDGLVVDSPSVLPEATAPASFVFRSSATRAHATFASASTAAATSTTWKMRRVPAASGAHWTGPEEVGMVVVVAVSVVVVGVVVVVVGCVWHHQNQYHEDEERMSAYIGEYVKRRIAHPKGTEVGVKQCCPIRTTRKRAQTTETMK